MSKADLSSRITQFERKFGGVKHHPDNLEKKNKFKSTGDIININVNKLDQTPLLLYTNNIQQNSINNVESALVPLINRESKKEVINNKCQDAIKKFIEISFAISVGAGMTPIISDQVYKLEDYGIHIHDLDSHLFAISTVNTLAVYAILGYMTMRGLLNDNAEPRQELSSCKK